MSAPQVDYSQTRQARRNRDVKAAKLVRAVERLDLSIADLAMGDGRRREIRREAGVAAAGEDTWYVVEQILRTRGHTAPSEPDPAPVAHPVVLATTAPTRPPAPAIEQAPALADPGPADRPVAAAAACWWLGCPTTGPTVHPYPAGPFCDVHAPWARNGGTRVVPPPGTTMAERMAATRGREGR